MKPREPESVPDHEDREKVAPHRAAQRLYDEMALAYREQAEEDEALSDRLLPASAESLALVDD